MTLPESLRLDSRSCRMTRRGSTECATPPAAIAIIRNTLWRNTDYSVPAAHCIIYGADYGVRAVG